jgi:hypothetical protein
MRHRLHASRVWAFAAGLCLSAQGAETYPLKMLDFLASVEPTPVAREVATREGYSLEGIQLGAAAGKASPGDTLCALVSLSTFDGRLKARQWLIRLRLATFVGTGAARDARYYTNAGDLFVFHSAVTAMDLETLGPILADTRADSRVERRQQRIEVNTDFLTLNLNRTASVVYRLHEQAEKSPGLKDDLSARGFAFPSGESAANRSKMEALGVSQDDRRSFTGSLPALMQFLDIVRSTPGLQEILLEVLDKPSVIDVFRHGGRADIDFNFVGGGPSPGREMFWKDARERDLGGLAFELSVFGKPALDVALFVTAPVPPLEVGAGILAVLAWSPSKPDKVVVVRILSSLPGPGAIPPSAIAR